MLLLFQQYELVLVNMCNLEFKHFKFFHFYDESEGDYHLRYVLDFDPLLLINSLKLTPWCQNM
jgi:hypothetical protein